MTRPILIVCAFISIVFFPYPATVALSFIASLFVPPVGFLAGFLTDILYLPAGHLPYASFAGLGISVVALLVRRFVKARIMGSNGEVFA